MPKSQPKPQPQPAPTLRIDGHITSGVPFEVEGENYQAGLATMLWSQTAEATFGISVAVYPDGTLHGSSSVDIPGPVKLWVTQKPRFKTITLATLTTTAL